MANGQEAELLVGFPFGRDEGFESSEDMERAWWMHRDRLLQEHRPLSRPHAFWSFEAKYIPGCGMDREPEEDALLRLRLDLRPQERSILTSQAPRGIPDVVPAGAIEHWERVVRSIATRAAWHEREGRQEQAQHWREQGERLEDRILEAKHARAEHREERVTQGAL